MEVGHLVLVERYLLKLSKCVTYDPSLSGPALWRGGSSVTFSLLLLEREMLGKGVDYGLRHLEVVRFWEMCGWERLHCG